MVYLWSFGCFINQHEPRRRDIKWDGLTFIADCRYCGKPIAREAPRDWRSRHTDSETNGA